MVKAQGGTDQKSYGGLYEIIFVFIAFLLLIFLPFNQNCKKIFINYSFEAILS